MALDLSMHSSRRTSRPDLPGSSASPAGLPSQQYQLSSQHQTQHQTQHQQQQDSPMALVTKKRVRFHHSDRVHHPYLHGKAAWRRMVLVVDSDEENRPPSVGSSGGSGPPSGGSSTTSGEGSAASSPSPSPVSATAAHWDSRLSSQDTSLHPAAMTGHVTVTTPRDHHVFTQLPSDPRDWSREDVANWLHSMKAAHDLSDLHPDRFLMNGKALCLMNANMFSYRVPLGGKLLYRDFRMRLTRALAHSTAPPTTTVHTTTSAPAVAPPTRA